MPESFKPDIALSHELSSRSTLPDDFPPYPFTEALLRTQARFPARRFNGEHVSGLTPQERFELRYVYVEYINRLIEYAHRKCDQTPEVSFVEIVDEITHLMFLQDWNLSKPGLDRLAQQLRDSFESKESHSVVRTWIRLFVAAVLNRFSRRIHL
ncbi:hypothetical protein AEP_01674 [Curvibacter sp. AEP1-3]|uniref:hypothetical protein n=1 Tax=Curvibacter sp. AEP1-3 TaxID=1844971 RepID=UPI000B3C2931|nr:hypothetical protein [Curvibacter sp. AEP1-3]ARV18618.1 hypothetical protein AEP_01674 [Curvibacter sp. AEP1-3]